MRCNDVRSWGGSPPVTAALREATKSRHLALHQAAPMRRLFAADYTLGEYRSHLASMLGVVEPLELAAERSGGTGLADDFLRRSERLREDLHAMGSSAAEIGSVPRCNSIAPMSPAGLQGYLYVALGSMLGGRMIARQVQTVLGPAASVNYYAQGAGRADTRWTSFCANLDAQGASDLDEMCAVAIATFDAFAGWLVPLGAARETLAC